ncbi:alkaline phosphatase family protein [Planctomycetota bacterium]
MVRRALLVVDQLPYAELRRNVPSTLGSAWSEAKPLCLDYVPRTTPPGHATISTGQCPANHRVQGREWYEEREGRWHKRSIEQVWPGTDGGWPYELREYFHARSLAATTRRREPKANIVVVGAKSFIPFLFGAWHADLSVFPLEVKPRQLGYPLWRPGLRLAVHAGTPKGAAQVTDLLPRVKRRLTTFLAMFADGSRVAGPVPREIRWNLPNRQSTWRYDFHWGFPSDWRLSPESHLASFLNEHAADIDAFYSEIGLRALGMLTPESTDLYVQSWFSTDWLGHRYGYSSQYQSSLENALRHAGQLRKRGFGVAVCSDHGGRSVVRTLPWRCSRNCEGMAQDGSVFSFPSVDPGTVPLRSGDHLVGYSRTNGPRVLTFVCGRGLVDVEVPDHVVTNSIVPGRSPAWMLLPADDERYGEAQSTPTLSVGSPCGTDHGATVEDGALSAKDNEVPLLWLGTSTAATPTRLHEVLDWFLELRS